MSCTLGAHVTSSQLRSIQPIPRLGARISATSTEYKADTNCPHRDCAATRLVPCAKGKTRKSEGVNFGNDWYRQTKVPRRTVRDELERRRDANFAANKGRDREDLYTDKWAGSEYKGSKFNILTVILIVSVLAPLFGIIFAYFSYGRLWG